MSHANARLTPAGRFVMVQRIGAGRPVAHVAAEMGISRTTAWRWWRRFQAEGCPGLVDRPSHAHSHPHRTPVCVETRVRIARMLSRRGPVWIGYHLGLPASATNSRDHDTKSARLAAQRSYGGSFTRITRSCYVRNPQANGIYLGGRVMRAIGG